MAMVNAFILYNKIGGTKAQLKFRKRVIASLLSSDIRINKDLPQTLNTASFYDHKSSDLSRLSAQHYWLITLQQLNKNAAKQCVVCIRQNQRKKARYMCETCPSKLASCAVPCFKKFPNEVCI